MISLFPFSLNPTFFSALFHPFLSLRSVFELWMWINQSPVGREAGTYSTRSPDWDTNQAKMSVCQQGELMGSPWFSHVRSTEEHSLPGSRSLVSGFFFLEASNPGGPLAWRHRARPLIPLSADVLYPHSHFLRSSQTPISAEVLFGRWRLNIWLKTECLIRHPGCQGGRRWVNVWAGAGTRPAAVQAPSPPLSPSSVGLILLPVLYHVTRKCGSPSFPLLAERKYCNRGGCRWALLRRGLKITGIFKAAEESQDRQRPDSLPPGWSSLLPLSVRHDPSLRFLLRDPFAA